MDQIFAFLFKYRPFIFAEGDFAFQSGLPVWGLLLLAGILLAGLAVTYRPGRLGWPPSRRWVLFSLRATLFLFLAVLMMGPGLIVSTVVPKQSLLALLVDNSLSMGLVDGEATRGERVARLLAPDATLLDQLGKKFQVQLYQFATDTRRLDSTTDLDWQGSRTDIAGALQQLLAQTRNLPLGGVVLWTDGASNTPADFRKILTEFQTRRLPVHTVGVGPTHLAQDVELTQVFAPRTVLPETMVGVRLTLRARGFEGRHGRLEVREDGTLVQTREVSFPRDSESWTTELTLRSHLPGVKVYDFRIEPMEGETILRNNSQTLLLQVRDQQPRILYVEGHPRWEYKFLRQALREDRHLRLETLLRTALNKFYRQGIEEETTLASGFPSTIEELFEYQGLVVGNVESSFFSYQQMEMVRDFVSQRGGGFLMLGGDHSFSSGLYQNTPIEDVLPVSLGAAQPDANLPAEAGYDQGQVPFHLTNHGMRHPALQLAAEEKTNRLVWSELPQLIDWNRVDSTKPGATVLARLKIPGRAGSSRQEAPLLVFQRYGKGHSLAFLTASSWRWQMLKDHRDRSHETFWRQVLRWLINRSRDPVSLETDRGVYGSQEPVLFRARVNDSTFSPINQSRVDLTVTTPSGQELLLSLAWNPGEDGVYEGRWTPLESGLHRAEMTVPPSPDSSETGSDRADTSFLVSDFSREYFDAVQKTDFLQGLADQTGGRHYSIGQADRLPDEIVYTESEYAVTKVLDLWDMPINLLILIGLLTGEWIQRRRYGAI